MRLEDYADGVIGEEGSEAFYGGVDFCGVVGVVVDQCAEWVHVVDFHTSVESGVEGSEIQLARQDVVGMVVVDLQVEVG